VIRQTYAAHTLTLELEAPGDSEQTLAVRVNTPVRSSDKTRLTVAGGTLRQDKLHIHFPAGAGYTHQTVTLRW
jgi:hypothetical protein